MQRASILLLRLTVAIVLLGGCAGDAPRVHEYGDASFTLAMIPDTQNYLDYSHQTAEGFALDASELFIEQMRWLADRGIAKGGEIAFVAAVGDVWEHQSEPVDPDHAARGLERIENPYLSRRVYPTPQTRTAEIPKAIEGYRLISEAGIPFGVAPGNHDYDAMWSVAGFPPNIAKNPAELAWTPEDIGMLHVGGLDNFRSAFGSNSPFFDGRSWYVASFRGGANSAQVFTAAGYRFLHLALEMHPDDEVLDWAQSVIERYQGYPTILTTHDYLSPKGERVAAAIIDLARVDPGFHNSAQEVWQALIAPNDQVFLVLCGHQHGQALRVDRNQAGHAVYQILADYQDRGRAGLEAGQPLDPHLGRPVGIGDGWLRLLRFELGSATPRIAVRTYSTYFKRTSSELAEYADWYREHEQAGMSDAEFLAAEHYELTLEDFRERFGAPRADR